MKAVVKYARGDGNVELRDVAVPRPRPGHVVVKVSACGICGTDLHIWHDEYPTAPPVVLGHEMSGVVVEVASDVETANPGDRVTAIPASYTCGRCRHCRSGRPYLCPERRSFGSGVDGAMAPWLVIPAHSLFKLPDSIDDTLGALTEPLACTVRGILDYGQPQVGDVVVISGPGPIGLFCAQVANLTGATVVVLGLSADERRLAIARSIGLSHVLDVQQTDPLAYIRELTNGEGADVVVECAGAEKSAYTCLKLARRGARFVQMGLYGKPIQFDLTDLVMREITLAGPFATVPGSWNRTLALLGTGKLDPRAVVTDQLALDDWSEGFHRAEAKGAGKILLRPN